MEFIEPLVNKKIQFFSDGDQDQDLILLFGQAWYIAFRAREKELAKYGLSPEQAQVLFIVQALKEKASPIRISSYIFRQRHSVSNILQRMEKKGLICKTKDLERKNMVRVSLTEKGKTLFELSKRRESTHKIMSSLNEEDRKKLLEYLLKIIEKSQEVLDSSEEGFSSSKVK